MPAQATYVSWPARRIRGGVDHQRSDSRERADFEHAIGVQQDAVNAEPTAVTSARRRPGSSFRTC